MHLFLRNLGKSAGGGGNVFSPDSSPTKLGTSKVTTAIFARFLRNTILNQISVQESQYYAECVDIDQDGFISKEDMETFINRGALIAKGQKQVSALNTKQMLFPTKPLNEKDMENLLRELRFVMDSRRMKNYELFAMLDTNEDGFVTIDEFCTGLEKIIPLPRPITEGFFAYIDKLKIGVLNLENFMNVLKKNIYEKEQVIFM